MTLTKMTLQGEVAMRPDEETAFLTLQSVIQSAINAQSLKNQAEKLLSASDITILRCYEHNVPVPAEWTVYRTTLRAIRDSGTGEFPTLPSYPAGT